MTKYDMSHPKYADGEEVDFGDEVRRPDRRYPGYIAAWDGNTKEVFVNWRIQPDIWLPELTKHDAKDLVFVEHYADSEREANAPAMM